MSTSELGLFSYEILGLVGRTGASAHDLRMMARNGRILDWAGESQYYSEPKRLAKLGYLETRTEPGKTRERTVYTLSEQGVAALREYARTPVRFTPVKSEPLLRLLIADLVGDAPTRYGLAELRGELHELSAQLDLVEERTTLFPHRRKHQMIVIGHLRRLLALHHDLIDEVERELAPE